MASRADQGVVRLQEEASRAGYVLTTLQQSLFDGGPDGLVPVADLAPRSNGAARTPRLRVFSLRRSAKSVPAEALDSARRDAQRAHIPFVAFVEGARSFRTYLTRGGDGFLPFLLPAPSGKTAPRFQEAQPFTSIAELRRIVGVLSDTIFAAHGHDRLRLFDNLLVLLAIKVFDELRFGDELRISRWLDGPTESLSEEASTFAAQALSALGCSDFAARLDVAGEALRSVLELLAQYSLRSTIELDTQAEVMGTFYQEVVSSTFRGSLGAYFTPKPVADLAAALCQPTPSDTVFDISCGSSTFLLSAHSAARTTGTGGSPMLFGGDIQERMVVTSALNCALHGIADAHFIHSDGLEIDLRKWRAKNRAVPKDGFSLIVGNPPFAGFDEHIESASAPGAQRGGGARVHKIIPFVDKVTELLAPGGRAVLVVPTSVLNGEANSYRALRERLKSRVRVSALVRLPGDAFVHTDCGVEGSLLAFEKSEATGHTFYWNIKSLGYDRKGRARGETDVANLRQALSSGGQERSTWIPTSELYELERWDVPWIEAAAAGRLNFTAESHVPLTQLCRVVRRNFSRREVEATERYRFFEVGDAEIDTGVVSRVRECSGGDLLLKGRLRLRVTKGDVLLPNHRDSLIAKTAAGVGRSAVFVDETLDGCITTDRFTVLEPLVEPGLLIALVNSRLVRSQLALHARGSASFDIRDKVLEEVMVPEVLLRDKKAARRVGDLLERRAALTKELEAIRRAIEQEIEQAGNR